MTALFATVRAFIPGSWKIIAVVAVIAGLVGWHMLAVHSARKEGMLQERTVWQEVQQKNKLAREAEKAAAEQAVAEISEETRRLEAELSAQGAEFEKRLLAITDDKVCIPGGVIK